jgi:hypothetical protein
MDTIVTLDQLLDHLNKVRQVYNGQLPVFWNRDGDLLQFEEPEIPRVESKDEFPWNCYETDLPENFLVFP